MSDDWSLINVGLVLLSCYPHDPKVISCMRIMLFLFLYTFISLSVSISLLMDGAAPLSI